MSGVYKIFDDGIGRKGIRASDYKVKDSYMQDWAAIKPSLASKFFQSFGKENNQFNIDKFLASNTDDREKLLLAVPKTRTAAEAQTLVKILAIYADHALSMSLHKRTKKPNIGLGLHGDNQLKRVFELAKHCGVSRSLNNLLTQEINSDKTPQANKKYLRDTLSNAAAPVGL